MPLEFSGAVVRSDAPEPSLDEWHRFLAETPGLKPIDFFELPNPFTSEQMRVIAPGALAEFTAGGRQIVVLRCFPEEGICIYGESDEPDAVDQIARAIAIRLGGNYETDF